MRPEVEFVSQQLRELLATFQCQAQERGQNMLTMLWRLVLISFL